MAEPEEDEEVEEVEEEEVGRRCTEALEEGERSLAPPPTTTLRFFISRLCCSKLRPPAACPACSPESPTITRLWELLGAE